MSKKKKSMVAAITAVVVLVAMLIILINLPNGHNDKNLQNSVSSAIDLTINNNSANDISSINIKNSNDIYTVNVVDGVCSIDDLSAIPTSNTDFSALTADAAGIAATQIIDENTTDLSIFGLDTPRAVVTINYKDQSFVKLSVGADAPASAGVYVSVNDGTKVYLFSSAKVDTFLYSRIDFVDKMITQNATSDKTSPIISRVTLEGTSRTQPIVFDGTSMGTYNIYTITSPNQKAADATAVANIVDQLQKMESSKVIAINPTNEQLIQYGLAEPYSRITAEYSNGSVTLISSAPKNDKVYVMNMSKPVIYQMSSTDQTWITAQYSDLASKTIISPTMSSLKTLTVTLDSNASYVFDISTNSVDGAETTAVKFNGNLVDIGNFTVFYQNIIGMRSRGFTDKALSGNPLLTYRFDYTDESKTADTVSFYTSDDDASKVLISLNGICDSLEYKTYIDKMIGDSAKVSVSETVEPIQ